MNNKVQPIDALRESFEKAKEIVEELHVDDATEFIKLKLPPRKMLLDPFIEEKSIGMLHAWRGTGKTHVGCGIAAAIASGGRFIRWQAKEPTPILYVDGEMADFDIQEWLKVEMSAEGILPIAPGYFNLIASDRQEREIPSLLTLDGQMRIEDKIGAAKLVILDNISSLFRSEASENADEGWQIAQHWLLALRRKGIATLLHHHDGKSFMQRGTSKKEDIMNYVLHLVHPRDYRMEQGLRAEIHFEKARRVRGTDAQSFEVQLIERDGIPVWLTRDIEAVLAETIRTMHDEQGASFREIAAELKTSKSNAERLYKKWKLTPEQREQGYKVPEEPKLPFGTKKPDVF